MEPIMEQRWIKRVQSNIDSVLSCAREDVFEVPGKITNISQVGMFIETNGKQLKKDTCVEIEFWAKGGPENEHYKVSGIVIRTCVHGIGVRIHVTDQTAERAIKAFCHYEDIH